MNRREDWLPENDESARLARLLALAEWPSAEPSSLARLRAFWQGLRRSEPTGRRCRRASAAAAALAACLLAACLLAVRHTSLVRLGASAGSSNSAEETAGQANRGTSRLDHVAPPGSLRPSVAQSPASPQPTPPTARQDLPTSPVLGPPAVGRPPTMFEALAFFARAAEMATRSPTHKPAGDPLERALAERIADPAGDLDALCGPLLPNRWACQQALLGWIGRCRSWEQLVAAIDLLGRLGDGESVPLLVQLSHQSPTHAAAIRALGRLADAQHVGRLVEQEEDPELRRDLLGSLIARGDAGSLAVYLSFVCPAQTSDLAAEALAAASDPPVDGLLAFFSSPLQDQRTAAAVALGRLDDPAVLARLVQMVSHEPHAREALVALAASTDESAVAFLAAARRDPALGALVRAAQSHVQGMFASRPVGSRRLPGATFQPRPRSIACTTQKRQSEHPQTLEVT